jgi:hypothetical protein
LLHSSSIDQKRFIVLVIPRQTEIVHTPKTPTRSPNRVP